MAATFSPPGSVEQSAAEARRCFNTARIPTYDTPEAAVAGFLHRVRYQHNQLLLLEAPPARPDLFEPDDAAARTIIANALRAGRSWLDAEEAASVLAAYGIPQPRAKAAADADEAVAGATAIGFPVALKIRSPDITHKSDVGGVALGLADAKSVHAEAGVGELVGEVLREKADVGDVPRARFCDRTGTE